VRNYLNSWIEKIPEDDAKDLIKRMKKDFEPPYYELFTHELFYQLGYNILIHPEIQGTTKRPDFFASKLTSEVYIEATLVTETTNEERLNELKRHKIIDQINEKIRSKNYFLRIYSISFKSNHIGSLKSFFCNLQSYLDSTNPDILEQLRPYDLTTTQGATFVYENENLKIVVELMAKPLESRNRYMNKIVGLIGGRGKLLDTTTAIRNSIRQKKGKYGAPNCPLIICLNITSPFGMHFDDAIDAFFGTSVYAPYEKKSYRHQDGVIGTSANPINTRISGILVSDVHFTGFNNARIFYYKNPYARFPFSLNGNISTFELVNGEIIKSLGKSLQEIVNPLPKWIT
jgi:hypothetical protein